MMIRASAWHRPVKPIKYMYNFIWTMKKRSKNARPETEKRLMGWKVLRETHFEGCFGVRRLIESHIWLWNKGGTADNTSVLWLGRDFFIGNCKMHDISHKNVTKISGKKSMSRNLEKNYNPKDFEKRIYTEWESNGLFKPDEDRSKEPYTIIMPPPNITG